MFKTLYLTILITIISACSQKTIDESHPIIQAYSDAWNAKDIEAMRNYMHPDIEWVSVKGNEIEVSISGKAALSETILSFFKDPNMATGSRKNWSINGDYIAVTEIADWTDTEGIAHSQSSLTVFQLETDLIRRVYYYPAKPEN